MTKTMSLQSGSLGIGQGHNTFSSKNGVVPVDKRGQLRNDTPNPHPRIAGSSVDIVAYEVQQSDITASNLEGCT
jgi:hypothetical protein